MAMRTRRSPSDTLSPQGEMTSPSSPSTRGDEYMSPHKNIQSRLRAVSMEHIATSPCSPARTRNRTVSKLFAIPQDEAPDDGLAIDDEDVRTLLQKTSLTHMVKEWVLLHFPLAGTLVSFFVHCTDLCFRSIPWFQFSAYTVLLGFRLILWAILLLPVLVSFFIAYLKDSRIYRRIRYGPSNAEYLDIYIPAEAEAAIRGEGPKAPVVVAIMGGGFVIGHRGYNAQLGLRCMECGVVLVCIDYSNFPFATLSDMVVNVGRGVKWVFNNIETYGGDPRNMVFSGQSAGAHLGAMLMVEHALLEAQSAAIGEQFDSWAAKDFKMYMGVSGPYNLAKMAPHMGLPDRIIRSMTHGDNDSCSPEALVGSEEWRDVAESAVARLPPLYLFHGEVDGLVPKESSISFAQKLKDNNIPVTLDVRRHINHTYPVIEGPMVRHDIQLEIILPVLLGDECAEKRLRSGAKSKPMWPLFIVRLAARLSPFGAHPP